MRQNLFKGQYLVPTVLGNKYNSSQIIYVEQSMILWDSLLSGENIYRVINPFVQTGFREYELQQLNKRNLIQCISKSKFLNCIYREGAEDIDSGIYISQKFGKLPVVLNAERTHCYFSHKGRFYKSKVWTDKLGVVYGACAGSQYGEYDGKR
jgi:hypothetical protein